MWSALQRHPKKCMSPTPHRSEDTSAPPKFSPGLVESDEIVLRTVWDPDHLEADGKLKVATAISLKDIKTRGWSVDRKQYTNYRKMKELHEDWQTTKPHIQRFHILPVSVREIRQIVLPSQLMTFVVIDCAECLRPSHAGVLLSGICGDGLARQFRNKLLEKLPQYTELERVFAPTDKNGYRTGLKRQLLAYVRWCFHWLFRN